MRQIVSATSLPNVFMKGYAAGYLAALRDRALPLIETGTAETVKQGSVRSMRAGSGPNPRRSNVTRD